MASSAITLPDIHPEIDQYNVKCLELYHHPLCVVREALNMQWHSEDCDDIRSSACGSHPKLTGVARVMPTAEGDVEEPACALATYTLRMQVHMQLEKAHRKQAGDRVPQRCLTLGGSMAPTSISWVLAAHANISDSHSISPEPVVLYKGKEAFPPDRFHEVPRALAERYRRCGQAERQRLWQAHLTSIAGASQQGWMKHAEPESAAARDVVVPLCTDVPLAFFWRVSPLIAVDGCSETGDLSPVYATLVSMMPERPQMREPPEPHLSLQRACSGVLTIHESDEEGMHSHFWLPLRVLGVLPHFPLPIDLARHTVASITSTSGYSDVAGPSASASSNYHTPRHHANSIGSVLAAAGAGLSTRSHNPLLSAEHSFRPADGATPSTFIMEMIPHGVRERIIRRWASLWCRAADPTNAPSHDFLFFPYGAFTYLEACARDRLRNVRPPAESSTTTYPVSHALTSGQPHRRTHQGSNDANAELWSDQGPAHSPSVAGNPNLMFRGTHGNVRMLASWRCPVPVLGCRYVCGSDTLLAGLVDSSLCTAQAVPLDECGNVLWRGLAAARAHMQTNLLSDTIGEQNVWSKPSNESIGSASGASVTSSATVLTQPPPSTSCLSKPASQGAQAAVRGSAFAERLREELVRSRGRPIRGSLGCGTQVLRSQNTQRRESGFRFRSPYWIAVETMKSRWGLEPVPGAVPIIVNNRAYVNAEQTLDASRFSPHTCAPKRVHEIPTCEGCATCSWAQSAALRQLLLPSLEVKRQGVHGVVVAAHSENAHCDDDTYQSTYPSAERKPGSSRGFSSSFTTIAPRHRNRVVAVDEEGRAGGRHCVKSANDVRAEADEVQRTENLWVGTDLCARAGWHLRPATSIVHVPRQELLSSSPGDHNYEPMADVVAANGGGSNRSLRNTFSVADDESLREASTVACVPAEAIVERSELVAVMAYAPTILYGVLDTQLTEVDAGYEDWASARQRLESQQQEQQNGRAHCGILQGRALADAYNTTIRAQERLVERIWFAAMSMKQRRMQRALRLPLRARLQLACLALARQRLLRSSSLGESDASYPLRRETDRWVTAEFLEAEPAVRLKERDDGYTVSPVVVDVHVPSMTAIKRDHRGQPPGAYHASHPGCEALTLYYEDDLEWPPIEEQQRLMRPWLYRTL